MGQKEKNESKQEQENSQEALQEQASTAEEKIKELTELLQRTQANLENYRKQMEKRMEEMQLLAGKQMLLQLLPIIDEFELALKNYNALGHTQNTGKEQIASPELVKGIELIYAHLTEFLGRQGIEPLVVEREKFDPYKHEALMKVPSDAPENTILEEFQKGYLLHGQVLRHAKVKISAGKKKSVQQEQPQKQNQS